jgi:hypothetical protein
MIATIDSGPRLSSRLDPRSQYSSIAPNAA